MPVLVRVARIATGGMRRMEFGTMKRALWHASPAAFQVPMRKRLGAKAIVCCSC
jgi:hypothetical protein